MRGSHGAPLLSRGRRGINLAPHEEGQGETRPEMATYVLRSNARCTDAGYALITSVEDCTLGGRSVGLLQSNQQATLGSYVQSNPAGCFSIGGVQVVQNANSASSGAGDVICRVAAAVASPPPPDIASTDLGGSSGLEGWQIALIVVAAVLIGILGCVCNFSDFWVEFFPASQRARGRGRGRSPPPPRARQPPRVRSEFLSPLPQRPPPRPPPRGGLYYAPPPGVPPRR